MDGDNSNTTSLDSYAADQKYLFAVLGPRRDPLSTIVPMTLVYSLIFVTGFVGNICTCIVIARNRYMHTTVNYYLFSLAVSDLLLLMVGIPQEISSLWQQYPYLFGETVCVVRGMISEMCTDASVLTITTFTVERYIAICHPLKAHTMAQLPRAIKAILIIWVVAALSSIPITLQLGLLYEVSNVTNQEIEGSSRCVAKYPVPTTFLITSILFFVLPMVLILVLYFLIGLKLRRSSRSMARNQSTAASPSHNSHHHHTTNHTTHPVTSFSHPTGNRVTIGNLGSDTVIIATNPRSVSVGRTDRASTSGVVPDITSEEASKDANGNLSDPDLTPDSKSGNRFLASSSAGASSTVGTNGTRPSPSPSHCTNSPSRARVNTRPSRLGSQNGNSYRQHAASRKAVVKMLVAVVVAFFICWAPFHLQRLMSTYDMNPTSHLLIFFQYILFHFSGVTYYISATINPILYNIMSLKFRMAFKDTLGRCYGRSPITGHHIDAERSLYHNKSQA